MGKGLINLLANRVAARIPHQSEIGSEEPISASFPPGEAEGAVRRRMEARKSIGKGGARPSPTESVVGALIKRPLQNCAAILKISEGNKIRIAKGNAILCPKLPGVLQSAANLLIL